MNDQRKTGGPAYPGPIYTEHGNHVGHSMGMSLRDWFAGQALTGLIASGLHAYDCTDNDAQAQYAAYRAYTVADAMLIMREENNA